MSGLLVSYMAAWPPSNTGSSTGLPIRAMLCCASALVLLLVLSGCVANEPRQAPQGFILETQHLPDGGVYLSPRDYLRLRRHLGLE